MSRKATAAPTSPTEATKPLPAGWRWVKLGEIIEDTRNGIYKPDEFYGSGTPILKMYNIGRFDGKWILDRVDRINLTREELNLYKLNNGDILINRVNSRELVGKCAVIDDSVSGAVFESKNIRLRLSNSVTLPEYVAFWLNNAACRRQVKGQLKQIVGQATINKGDLNAIDLLLPPLPEQKRIAAILAEQLAVVDKARAAAEAQLEVAKALPAAYLRQFFPKEGESPPKGWRWARLEELCQISSKLVDPKLIEFSSLPHVSAEDIESGTGKLLVLNSAAEDGMISGKYLFEPGCILYSKIRPYLRKVAYADFRGLCSADMYPLEVSRKADPIFLLWLLLSATFTEYADRESRRARMPKLNREQLFSYTAPVPTLSEQIQIAKMLSEQYENTQKVCSAITSQLANINALPAALLRQAFSGEL